MPELPEVETIKRDLEKAIKNKKIAQVEVLEPKMVSPLSPSLFEKGLKGKKIIDLDRRAKILLIDLSGKLTIMTHLKLTGQLIFRPAKGKMIIGGHPHAKGVVDLPNKFTRVCLQFSDKSELFFNDIRKFGWMRLVETKEVSKLVAHLGLEPLSPEFNFENFKARIKKFSRRTIKQVLLDQTVFAGLGNIYVDESSFRAKVLPYRKIEALSLAELKRLHKGIVDVLKLSIAKKGTSFRDYVRASGKQGGFVPYLQAYGRKGEKCKRCKKGIIQKITHAGRGTFFCDQCQK